MKTSSRSGNAEFVNGIEMYYEIHGEGEPLVLLHGFTGSGADWQLIFQNPPEGYRLFIPDLRGHGAQPILQRSLRFANARLTCTHCSID